MTHSKSRFDGLTWSEVEAAMTPAQRAMVAELDGLDALKQAGQLSGEDETRWYILTRAVDGIFYRAAMMARVNGAQDEPGTSCP